MTSEVTLHNNVINHVTIRPPEEGHAACATSESAEGGFGGEVRNRGEARAQLWSRKLRVRVQWHWAEARLFRAHRSSSLPRTVDDIGAKGGDRGRKC